jgi:hypothetical protein
MLDFPETLIVLLTILLLLLATRHWLSVNGLRRGERSNKSDRA